MRIDKCPGCGGELRFDIHTSKQHCSACGRIWSFGVDFEERKLIVREWKRIELNKDKCTFDIDLHRDIWVHGYKTAIEAIRKEVKRRMTFHDGAMKACSGLNTISLTHSAGWKEDNELLSFLDGLEKQEQDGFDRQD